jgi:CubicO group peptidase (beta-lactamase class C family)
MSELRNLLQRYVDRGAVPGAVAALGKDDPEIVAVGSLAVGGPTMPSDAIVRIQSMTKVITAVVVLRLVERGDVDLDESVVPWLPELADRRVLTSPTAPLTDTRPATRDITLRHLLTNTSGYGMIFQPSPLQEAMVENGTEAGPEPPSFGADEWLARLAKLPLVGDPGDAWRYHHSFGVLGILLARLTGQRIEHVVVDELRDFGLWDTHFYVRGGQHHRLPAAYRHGPDGLVETEPAGGGFYARPPAFDIGHGELVSTAADFHRFARLLASGELTSLYHLRLLSTDQVPARCKTENSFFPGFWDGLGWGFGVAVRTGGAHAGRYGWSGGLGTDFFVDPDGTVGVLLTQVEMGPEVFPLIGEFAELG